MIEYKWAPRWYRLANLPTSLVRFHWLGFKLKASLKDRWAYSKWLIGVANLKQEEYSMLMDELDKIR